MTLLPIIGGAMMVCKGEISGSLTGVIILLVSCFVSTIKGIVTKLLLSSGNKLSPLHLLTIVRLMPSVNGRTAVWVLWN